MIFQSLLEFALILSFWSTYIVILYESAFLIIPLKKIALKIHKESSLKEDLVREGERNFPGGSNSKVSAYNAGRRRIDAFELWCWRRLLRVP